MKLFGPGGSEQPAQSSHAHFFVRCAGSVCEAGIKVRESVVPEGGHSPIFGQSLDQRLFDTWRSCCCARFRGVGRLPCVEISRACRSRHDRHCNQRISLELHTSGHTYLRISLYEKDCSKTQLQTQLQRARRAHRVQRVASADRIELSE